MILKNDYFVKKLNETLFEGSSADLINKIVDKPYRYIGIFRPTKPRTKLIQNITQSHEIRFGDALENIVEEYFNALGFTILDKKLLKEETKHNKEYNIDQLIKKNNIIYLIEQKVRDDHDSTKKVGQFANFEAKYFEVARKYQNNRVIPIMWFIDDSLKKNRKYYTKQMKEMADFYNCDPKLYYGVEMFSGSETGIVDFPKEMWNEIIEYLTKWKETLPEMPEVNLDLNSEEAFEELKDLSPAIYRRLFKNEEIKEQIFPIIFTEGIVLKKLRDFFIEKDETAYKKIAQKIDEYLKQKFE